MSSTHGNWGWQGHTADMIADSLTTSTWLASLKNPAARDEYAVLLAKDGSAEDAKAMYYFGLRGAMLQPISRLQEPAPFLVVFDPEPEGIYWEYTPQRLEAAASMLQAMLSSEVTDFATNQSTTSHQFLERARALASDWFYPVLFLASQKDLDSPLRAQLTAEAEALAKPGLERQLMQRFRQDFAELLVINEQNGALDAVWVGSARNPKITKNLAGSSKSPSKLGVMQAEKAPQG